MRTNWLPRVAALCSRLYEPINWPADRDVDARRVRGELDAIRARFPDHA